MYLYVDNKDFLMGSSYIRWFDVRVVCFKMKIINVVLFKISNFKFMYF